MESETSEAKRCKPSDNCMKEKISELNVSLEEKRYECSKLKEKLAEKDKEIWKWKVESKILRQGINELGETAEEHDNEIKSLRAEAEMWKLENVVSLGKLEALKNRIDSRRTA